MEVFIEYVDVCEVEAGVELVGVCSHRVDPS